MTVMMMMMMMMMMMIVSTAWTNRVLLFPLQEAAVATT